VRHAVIHGKEREGDVFRTEPAAGVRLRLAERNLKAFLGPAGERYVPGDPARARPSPPAWRPGGRGEGGRPECRLDPLPHRVEVEAEFVRLIGPENTAMAVLAVHGLLGDAEAGGDVLPRRSQFPRVADLEDLQPIREYPQGGNRPQPDVRVVAAAPSAISAVLRMSVSIC